MATRRRVLERPTRSRPAAARRPETVVAAMPRWKRVVFALLPTLVLVLAAEGVARVGRLDAPSVRNAGLPEESVGLLRLDPELFWSLRPGLRLPSQGATVATPVVR